MCAAHGSHEPDVWRQGAAAGATGAAAAAAARATLVRALECGHQDDWRDNELTNQAARQKCWQAPLARHNEPLICLHNFAPPPAPKRNTGASSISTSDDDRLMLILRAIILRSDPIGPRTTMQIYNGASIDLGGAWWRCGVAPTRPGQLNGRQNAIIIGPASLGRARRRLAWARTHPHPRPHTHTHWHRVGLPTNQNE